MKWIINSAVIPNPGKYAYKLITKEDAVKWYEDGEEPQSAIGYEQTAQILSTLLQNPVAVNRTVIKMDVGDTALVFRPNAVRIDPAKKGTLSVEELLKDYEIGLLIRTE